jgi:carbamoyl-phosphate synthase/aspartate carbamoyltransferase/dihydroorotase
MALTRLPALVDVHVHVREPGATHKEDWDSASAAALAGGISSILAMPNTQPAITDEASLAIPQQAAAAKARCDYAHFLGGSVDNAQAGAALAGRVAGLKLYLDQTYGDLKLDQLSDWQRHFAHWPRQQPLAVHAEGRSLATAILLAALHDRPVHLCHVSRQDEIELIRAAKAKGLPVTCEVTPHHLFLCEDDIPSLGSGRAEVRPRLATATDRDALWANLDVIDCFASDHAPHTLKEKDSADPPPGFAGLESMLPLLLTAVSQRRLSLEDVILRLSENPCRIFGLPSAADSYVEVDLDARYELHAAKLHSRCGWTPFEGHPVQGRVQRVVQRGELVFEDGRVLAAPGSGRDLRASQTN